MDSTQSLKGISRIETSSTFGWYVRVYRNKKTYSKFFSDSKFGGKDKALEMAISQKEELNKLIIGIPKKPTKRRVVTTDKRNTTGVLGVSRTSKKHLMESLITAIRLVGDLSRKFKSLPLFP